MRMAEETAILAAQYDIMAGPSVDECELSIKMMGPI